MFGLNFELHVKKVELFTSIQYEVSGCETPPVYFPTEPLALRFVYKQKQNILTRYELFNKLEQKLKEREADISGNSVANRVVLCQRIKDLIILYNFTRYLKSNDWDVICDLTNNNSWYLNNDVINAYVIIKSIEFVYNLKPTNSVQNQSNAEPVYHVFVVRKFTNVYTYGTGYYIQNSNTLIDRSIEDWKMFSTSTALKMLK